MSRIDYSRDVLVDGATGTHFITSRGGTDPYAGYVSPWLTDPAYEEAMEAFVISCVDIIIVDSRGRVVAAKRKQEPQPDWWVFGGRRVAGDTTHIASAIRILRREVNIEAVPSHFGTNPIGHYDYVWDTNAQNGGRCHTETTVLLYRIADREWDAFRANEEYERVEPMTPEEILGAPLGTYHPAFVRMVSDYLDRSL